VGVKGRVVEEVCADTSEAAHAAAENIRAALTNQVGAGIRHRGGVPVLFNIKKEIIPLPPSVSSPRSTAKKSPWVGLFGVEDVPRFARENVVNLFFGPDSGPESLPRALATGVRFRMDEGLSHQGLFESLRRGQFGSRMDPNEWPKKFIYDFAFLQREQFRKFGPEMTRAQAEELLLLN